MHAVTSLHRLGLLSALPRAPIRKAASSVGGVVLSQRQLQTLTISEECFPQGQLELPTQTHTISEDRMHEFLRAEASYFAAREPQSISVRQVIDASTPRKAAQLSARELPVRYAHRIQQIESLPGWQTSKDIVEVHGMYFDAFLGIRLLDDPDNGNLDEFTDKVRSVKTRFQYVIPHLSTGMRELQRTQGFSEAFIQDWLDTFFLSRIGTEMLSSQYMATAKSASMGAKCGIVNDECDPVAICRKAARHAQKLCQDHFGLKEHNVKILVETQVDSSLADSFGRIRFPYIPQYLCFIMVELLKNSARATVENTARPADLRHKPIVVTVCADHSQVAIRVSDRASGIPFNVAQSVWSYMYSTVPKTGAGSSFFARGSPLAGFGVGLPLSRLYARYLGGSLQLMSMPGIGTDAYLHLKRIETEAREKVPNTLDLDSLGSLDIPSLHTLKTLG
jgi:pyruvate dehydrogenase kinase 2/3/4